MLTLAVSQVFKPLSYAAFSNGNASSSSITHGCHSLLPKLMAPRIGTDTRKPDLPNRLYSALVSLIDLITGSLLLLISRFAILTIELDFSENSRTIAMSRGYIGEQRDFLRLNVFIQSLWHHSPPSFSNSTTPAACGGDRQYRGHYGF